MPANEWGTLLEQARNLPPEQRIELIRFLTESLSAEKENAQPMAFGKYRDSGQKPSTAEDFEIAEWHPTDVHLNGH